MSGRAPACGDCCGCGVCLSSANIPFCLRFSGITNHSYETDDCADCAHLNDVFDTVGDPFAGSFILDATGRSGELLGEDRWPVELSELRACAIADHNFFDACGIGFALTDGSLNGPCGAAGGAIRFYHVRAVLLKPNQAGMSPGTSELHVFVYRSPTSDPSGCLLLLHAKHVFPSVPFDCSDVDWTAMEIVYVNEDDLSLEGGECDWAGVGLDFKFGGECGTGSPVSDDACCADTEDFPATLHATVVKNGVTLYDDDLDEQFAADGYLYQDHDGEELVAALGCSCPEPPCPDNLVFFNLLGVISRNLTVHSCSPYHASEAFTDGGGNVWEIEVTA